MAEGDTSRYAANRMHPLLEGRALRDLSDAEALAVVEAARARMRPAATRGRQDRDHRVYDRAGLQCRRCGGRIRARGQGYDNRRTFWCLDCQR